MRSLTGIMNIKKLILGLAAVLSLSLFLYAAPAGAQTGKLCEGADLSFSGGQGCETGEKDAQGNKISAGEKVTNLVTAIVNLFSIIVGIVAVIMIIYGGFRYITSGGDSGKVTDARNTILYAIVGLIIVAFAQFIVKFVLSRIAK